ncbi:CHASE2 domain-containing protein [Calothrix sp. PCC 7507]|uniref:CHASE2 domain-containing protein n=1 Tax=Calothrix sp. PCC 7507 TaxID=99598 RepID=UPI00029EE4E8|nr:CHASE2 domain-containing protein [Calothrix sp. PCC 7507]AFY31636.1 CHASE2 domain protein [Calothrix sp. PCC 7507]
MTKFYLQVQQVENKCLFQLSWNHNQKITAELPYPENIISDYKTWQGIYHNFYSQEFRGKVINTGVVAPPMVDWQAQLVQAEAKLLYEFHQWLRGKELYDIRSILTAININNQDAINQQLNKLKNTSTEFIADIFISCNTPELTRLPWESWEISTQFSTTKLRIARQPLNIYQSIKKRKITPRQVRVLAIFGDDSGLNFAQEKKAILALQKLIKVDFISWQEGKDIQGFKYEIVEKLTSNQGWDILYFAGHSRETDLTGGQISIAPNATISLSEIEKPLTTAIEKGLQFALFNSCDGLSIANKLIELGLNQVAIMREPIHNRVAEEIFIQFLNNVSQYQDVHQALLRACDYLKLEKNLTYPSAYLIPSLFRHPSSPLFRLEPFGFKQYIKRLTPTPLEAVTISALALISLQIPLQAWLLEKRILVQAMYRNMTNQVVPKTTPPILLVQIDNESINKAGILTPRPIDRAYMAQIIDKLVELKAPVVGIDYLLDRPDLKRDRTLSKSLQAGFNDSSQPTRFVFATTRDSQGKWLKVHPQIASPNWSLAGEIEILPGWYMQLLPSHKSNPKPRSFAYLLAVSQQLRQLSNSLPPQLTSKQDLWNYINNTALTSTRYSARSQLQPLTAFSYNLHQMWLHPIIDFSIPPQQIYQTIPAWKLLEHQTISSLPQKLQQQIVIVAPGGYEEAGTGQDNEDNFKLPAAMGYWRHQDNPDNTRGVLTGGEIHAYMTHHYLNNRMIIPIPDLWAIALAILLGKFISEYLMNNPEQRRQLVILLSVGSTAYTLISLELYISSAAILVPWLLPTTTFWLYILRCIFKFKQAKIFTEK